LKAFKETDKTAFCRFFLWCTFASHCNQSPFLFEVTERAFFKGMLYNIPECLFARKTSLG
jgi:hypothetical protein